VELLSTLLASLALAAPPPVGAPLPQDGPGLRAAYATTTRALNAATAAWAGKGPAPPEVGLYALYQQRIVRFLARKAELARAVPAAREDVAARRALMALTSPYPASKRIRIAAPPPPLRLLAWYRQAQRRFAVPWNVLAAVHFVETRFGIVRNDSVSGAQGPLQFLPATWRAYGLGGNVHDPRDAILGAANLLRANGAPSRMQAALYQYNHSDLYVDAVLRYARRMRTDEHAFLAYYSWPVYIATATGVRRVTGPR
jgi:membrane-bound lytic murein transglycosylase B